jgi:hypothetical protein
MDSTYCRLTTEIFEMRCKSKYAYTLVVRFLKMSFYES